MKYISLATLLFSLAISGCAITVSELKDTHTSYDGNLISNTGAYETYRTLKYMARQCLEYAEFLGNPVVVLSEFDTERKEGEINQKLLADGLLINNTLIEIESHDGDKAKVSLYTTKNVLSMGIRSPTLIDINRWAGGDRTC
nr:hypothetical protein [uncultured Cedecea sp.]